MARMARTPAPAGRWIGYARVSTDDQGTNPQRDELRAAGCTAIREEGVSARFVQNCTLTGISGRFRTRAASLARWRQVCSATRLHPASGAKPVRNP